MISGLRGLVFAVLVAVALWTFAPPVAADETEGEQAAPASPSEPERSEPERTEPEVSEPESTPVAGVDANSDGKLSAEEELGMDPCAVPKNPREAWVDRMQRGVFWTVCSTSRWFDGFYGDANDYRDYRSTYGRFGVALGYDEQNGGLDVDTRFKARFNFPKLERRIDAFIGRVDEQDFVEGRNEDFGALPRLFADTDTEWLLGLGYNPARDAKSRFDVDGGVRLDFPMDPYLRARWRTHHPLGAKRLVRFSQTGFWRRSLGTGTTSQLDVERALGPSFLTRWRTVGTVAEQIEGLEWRTSLTLYQLIFEDSALAYQIEGKGETDADIPLTDWSVGLVYRQKMWRDWFFLEVRGRVHWPKQELDEKRQAENGFAVGFEILFGDHPSLAGRRASWDEVDRAVDRAAQEAGERARREKADQSQDSDG